MYSFDSHTTASSIKIAFYRHKYIIHAVNDCIQNNENPYIKDDNLAKRVIPNCANLQFIATDWAFWRAGNPFLHTFYVGVGGAFAIKGVFEFFYIVGAFSAIDNFIGFQTDETFVFHLLLRYILLVVV